jgi:hypothetical protein
LVVHKQVRSCHVVAGACRDIKPPPPPSSQPSAVIPDDPLAAGISTSSSGSQHLSVVPPTPGVVSSRPSVALLSSRGAAADAWAGSPHGSFMGAGSAAGEMGRTQQAVVVTRLLPQDSSWPLCMQQRCHVRGRSASWANPCWMPGLAAHMAASSALAQQQVSWDPSYEHSKVLLSVVSCPKTQQAFVVTRLLPQDTSSFMGGGSAAGETG